ncbi:Nn.00g010290.m01.CDS01 [Neocucurbitaria sp. VM-36]
MIERVDSVWEQTELIPFLDTAFGERERAAWEKKICSAEHDIDNIRFYEDFPSTVESLRLALINPDVLTAPEIKLFSSRVTKDVDMCVGIFVRHAIRHEPFPLFSLGDAPSRDFPRQQDGPAKADNAEELSDAGETTQRQLSAQDAEPVDGGLSASKPQGKKKGKGKPRGHGSTGLGKLGYGRLPGPVSSKLAYETPQDRPTHVDRAYAIPPPHDARSERATGFCTVPSFEATEQQRIPEYKQAFFPVQQQVHSGAYGMQRPYGNSVINPSAGLYTMPSYTLLHTGSATSGACLGRSYQSKPSPELVTPSGFQYSVAPLQSEASMFQPGAGPHRLRGEALDFVPMAAPQCL